MMYNLATIFHITASFDERNSNLDVHHIKKVYHWNCVQHSSIIIILCMKSIYDGLIFRNGDYYQDIFWMTCNKVICIIANMNIRYTRHCRSKRLVMNHILWMLPLTLLIIDMQQQLANVYFLFQAILNFHLHPLVRIQKSQFSEKMFL